MEEEQRRGDREARMREEMAGWLGAVIKDMEGRLAGGEGEVLRRLARRRSRRETRAIWSEIRHGALRRSNSVEDVEEQLGHVD